MFQEPQRRRRLIFWTISWIWGEIYFRTIYSRLPSSRSGSCPRPHTFSISCSRPHKPFAYPVLVLTKLILSSSSQILSCPRPYKHYPVLVLTNLILSSFSQTLCSSCIRPHKTCPVSSSQNLSCPRPHKPYPVLVLTNIILS